ncbi:MAG: hypothetical protein MI976_26085 [Pseudomonadales bacterium]|nr:hypothetical protein [Pseudomonadales bacterium]
MNKYGSHCSGLAAFFSLQWAVLVKVSWSLFLHGGQTFLNIRQLEAKHLRAFMVFKGIENGDNQNVILRNRTGKTKWRLP